MTALEKHDNQILHIINLIVDNISKNNWKRVYDLQKSLNSLLRDRREFTRYQYLDEKRKEVTQCQH